MRDSEDKTREQKAAPWMVIAHRYAGLRELDELGGLSDTVRGFFLNTRFPTPLVTVKTAWCSAFACTVLELSGLPHPRSARARDFLKSPHFFQIRAPVYGSLLVFERKTADARSVTDLYGHVGFCDRDLVSPAQLEVACYGGNQDNCVCTRRKPLELLIAPLWPRGWPLPPGAVAA